MDMSKLVPPHGGKGLVCCLLEGDALKAELEKAKGLKQVEISSRAKGDLIMMGIGGFSPLDGFMGKERLREHAPRRRHLLARADHPRHLR